MKHIKKRYVFDTKVDFSIQEIYDKNKPKDDNPKDFYRKNADAIEYGIIQTHDNRIIQSFLWKINGKPIVIPEPDPCVIYFSNAQNILSSLNSSREKLKKIDNYKEIDEINNSFYTFFQFASIFVVNLLTSLEAFNNSLIPNDYKYNDNKKNKILDKPEIQRKIDFETKIKKVIPDVFGKSFITDYSQKYESIKKLKELRDEVIHTKNYQSNFPECYRSIYISYLECDFENLISNVKDYINYYKPDWIEDCDCGAEL